MFTIIFFSFFLLCALCLEIYSFDFVVEVNSWSYNAICNKNKCLSWKLWKMTYNVILGSPSISFSIKNNCPKCFWSSCKLTIDHKILYKNPQIWPKISDFLGINRRLSLDIGFYHGGEIYVKICNFRRGKWSKVIRFIDNAAKLVALAYTFLCLCVKIILNFTDKKVAKWAHTS